MSDLVLVTGASSDIGRALISSLAAPGVTILAHYHSSGEPLEALRASLPSGSTLVPLRADLRQPAEVEAMIARVTREHGTPNKLVHLAASKFALTRLTQFDWEAALGDLEIQVHTLAALLKSFLPAMTKGTAPGKVVVLSSSVTLGLPPKWLSSYSIVKYAQLGLVRAAAAEYAGKNVTINAVSPSMVGTRFLSDVPEKYVEMAAAAHPYQRNARIDEVVPLLAFLLSPASDYITGANMPVTGGSAA